MYYLWNTGALSQRLVDAVREETGIPIVLLDHPMPQEVGVRRSERYDEGAAILGGYLSVASERELTERELDIVSAYWTGKTQLRTHQ